MAGDYVADPQLPGPAVHPVEFQEAIAVDTGVGGTACLIGGDKPVHHLAPEVLFEVEYVIGHAQLGRHSPGVLHILQGAAGPRLGRGHVLVLIQSHGSPHTRKAGLFH